MNNFIQKFKNDVYRRLTIISIKLFLIFRFYPQPEVFTVVGVVQCPEVYSVFKIGNSKFANSRRIRKMSGNLIVS